MGLLKSIKKAVKKVTGNKVFKTVFPVASIANSKAGQAVGLGLAGGLGLSSLFSGAGAGAVATEGVSNSDGFLGGLTNLAKGLFTGGKEGSFGSSFLGGLFNTGLGLLGSKYTADNQLKKDLQLQDNAFAQNVAMWDMQNAYNTPLAQMERYRAAGLNPNLIYGNGVSSAGNASSAPQYEAPRYKGIDLSSILMFQQFENLNAQNQLLASQTELARTQAVGAGIDNKVKAINAGYAGDMAEANLALKYAERDSIIANTGNTKTTTEKNTRGLSFINRVKGYFNDWNSTFMPDTSDFEYRRQLRDKYGKNWRKYYKKK